MSYAERLDEVTHDVERRLAPVEDVVSNRLDDVANAMPSGARRVLGGEWLGHPLHPLLTDLPIGFWTSSFVLDFAGKRAARTSAAMTGLGVATAVPTIAAGVVEFGKIDDPKAKREAALHMICNAIATALYGLSFVARLKKMRGRGVLFGMLGATVATAGGYLGGRLAYEPTSAGQSCDQGAAVSS